MILGKLLYHHLYVMNDTPCRLGACRTTTDATVNDQRGDTEARRFCHVPNRNRGREEGDDILDVYELTGTGKRTEEGVEHAHFYAGVG